MLKVRTNDIVDTLLSKFGTITILFDKEQEVTIKDANIALELELFKLELNTFSTHPVLKFDIIWDMMNALQVRIDALVNAPTQRMLKVAM